MIYGKCTIINSLNEKIVVVYVVLEKHDNLFYWVPVYIDLEIIRCFYRFTRYKDSANIFDRFLFLESDLCNIY